MSATFVPPLIEVGDPVLLFRGRHEVQGSPGFVTKISAVAISALHCGTNAEYHGVRHKNDPILDLRPDLISDAGGMIWELSPWITRIRGLEDQVADHSKTLGVLAHRAAVSEQTVRKVKPDGTTT